MNTKQPLLNNDLTRKKIEGEIRKRLAEKKLAEITSGRPDVAVRYNLGAVPRTETNVFRGPRGRVRAATKSVNAEGMLTIDLLDGNTRDLVWRAVVREEERDAARLQDKLDDMVKKALDKYPPKK